MSPRSSSGRRGPSHSIPVETAPNDEIHGRGGQPLPTFERTVTADSQWKRATEDPLMERVATAGRARNQKKQRAKSDARHSGTRRTKSGKKRRSAR